MNKKRIFLGLGAVVLAVGGAFAGRMSAKFGDAIQVYYKVGTGTCSTSPGATFATNAVFQTSISGTAIPAFKTSGNSVNVALFATSSCNKQLYFVP
jgi:hypothetical protein